MTFKDVYKLALKRCNAKEGDSYIEEVIKGAVNLAYIIVATKIDKTVKSQGLAYSKVIKLPDDFYSPVVLLDGEYEITESEHEIKGNVIVIKTSDTLSNLTMHYISYPSKLANDGDTLTVNDGCALACAIYGAYAYMLSSGKINEAKMLFDEFNVFLKSNGIDLEVNLYDTKRTN
jgi:hypothetical protein